jgi:folate-dependent phosphoribosylglycinamide formyltransferase PurN
MIARHVRKGALWKYSNVRMFLRGAINQQRNSKAGYSDRDHLLAAVEWLERAQDVTGDGGICGRYSLKEGWSSSYPETTGYIVPTFLALARELGDARFHKRAEKCVEFLLSLQLSEGAFPAGEVADNRTDPSVFNTAQIIHGLVSWHAAAADDRALQAARRAGEWLLSVQDQDGAWRQYSYENVATTYSAHAGCWLAQLGQHAGEQRFLRASSRHLDWVLSHCDPETGWIDLCGFSTQEHQARVGLTHTVAYTLWGILLTSEILGRIDGLNAARRAAEAIARRLELSRWLPGVLNYRWEGQVEFACLTGNAQMAVLWFRLYERDSDPRYLNAALKALDLVKAAQPMDRAEREIRGGIPGSDPIWGDYIYATIPNWSAKYFIDAMLAKKDILAALPERPRGRWQVPQDVPTRLPRSPITPSVRRPKVVIYTSPTSTKVAQMLEDWSSWNFRPDRVLIERRPSEGRYSRLRKKVRNDGFRWIFNRFVRNPAVHRLVASSESWEDPISVCRRNNIPYVEVGPLESAESLELIRKMEPDLAIHAGAGIMRASLLSIHKLGTLNAHMGILPFYRGMNVAEWAAFTDDPVGCTVHWIDPGIDTGDIICVRMIDPSRCRSIAQLRSAVDKAQMGLLGEVVRLIVESGQGIPGRKQAYAEGLQFFQMHGELVAVLEAELAKGRGPTAEFPPV